MLQDIEFKVKDIIKNILGIAVDEFKLEYELSSLGINSISFIKIVVAIEEEFDFEFDDEDLYFNNMRTLKDILIYIQNRIKS